VTGRPNWRTIGIAVFAVAALLLISYGGAIFAAPVTLPLMFLSVRRHPTTGFRTAGAVLGALTTAELTWAFTYAAVREAQPWIWLTPLLAAVAAGAVFMTAARWVRAAQSVPNAG
jgi:hypothetical protein